MINVNEIIENAIKEKIAKMSLSEIINEFVLCKNEETTAPLKIQLLRSSPLTAPLVIAPSLSTGLKNKRVYTSRNRLYEQNKDKIIELIKSGLSVRAISKKIEGAAYDTLIKYVKRNELYAYAAGGAWKIGRPKKSLDSDIVLDPDSTSINALKLSFETKARLRKNKIYLLSELTRYTPFELLKLEGFGIKRVDNIATELREIGLNLNYGESMIEAQKEAA